MVSRSIKEAHRTSQKCNKPSNWKHQGEGGDGGGGGDDLEEVCSSHELKDVSGLDRQLLCWAVVQILHHLQCQSGQGQADLDDSDLCTTVATNKTNHLKNFVSDVVDLENRWRPLAELGVQHWPASLSSNLTFPFPSHSLWTMAHLFITPGFSWNQIKR